MARFEVQYTITITRTYSMMISAKDLDTAEEKAQERLEKVQGTKFPGDMEGEEVEFQIDDVIED